MDENEMLNFSDEQYSQCYQSPFGKYEVIDVLGKYEEQMELFMRNPRFYQILYNI